MTHPCLTIVIEGPPVAKGRARIGKNPHTGRPRSFTPAETERFESRVKHRAWLAMRERGLPVLQGAVELVVDAYFPALKNAKHAAPKPKDTRPDADNIGKAIADALNGVVYRDDGQVWRIVVQKWWAVPGAMAETVVNVLPTEEWS